MEMEEGHNQPKISSKFEDVVQKGEEDRISSLPDCLIIEILSRLDSAEEAIRTGTLSKRWQHVWTSLHTLIFTYLDYPLILRRQNPKSRPDFISFMDKTLAQCRQIKLKKFQVSVSVDIEFESQFYNWIRHAISCNVEELHISLWYNSEYKFSLDQSFFINTCFTDLRLSGCIFNPVGAISWKNLRNLCISYGKLDENVIENILSGSPILETLVLEQCYGYKLLNITSKSVKKLVFSGYWNPEDEYDDENAIIKINAPNLLSLTVLGGLWLRKLILVNMSSVVEAKLNYSKVGYGETVCEEAEEEMLKGFILSLAHVKDLKLRDSQILSRLKAKGFVFPSNMKFPCLWVDSDSDLVESGDGEVLLLDDNEI